jgi:phage-related holin
MFWDRLVEFFLVLWGSTQVKVLLTHILINVVVAVAAAIVTKEFFFGKIGQFLYQKILPFLLVYIVAVAVGEAAGFAWLATAAWLVLELNLLGDLTDSLSRLGIPMPPLGLEKKPDITVAIVKLPPADEVASDADEALAEATEAYEVETGEAPPHATPNLYGTVTYTVPPSG